MRSDLFNVLTSATPLENKLVGFTSSNKLTCINVGWRSAIHAGIPVVGWVCLPYHRLELFAHKPHIIIITLLLPGHELERHSSLPILSLSV